MTKKNDTKNANEDRLAKLFDKKNVLKESSPLNFSCNSCGECCHNQDIILSTYDILKLRVELQMPTMFILSQHCKIYKGPNSKLPVCLLRFKKIEELDLTVCPFLMPSYHKEAEDVMELCENNEERRKAVRIISEKHRKKGKVKYVCTIHKNSPEICKLYPLGRGTKFNTKTKKQEIMYAMLDKKELPCSKECFECKNTVKDHLKANGLINPEMEKLKNRYNLGLANLSEITRKNSITDIEFRVLVMFFFDFDTILLYQKMLQEKDVDLEKIMKGIDSVSAEKGKTTREILKELKKYPELDKKILIETLKPDAKDKGLSNSLEHLIKTQETILSLLTKKYAKKV